MTFPNYLRAMRRADLADDPRFATAALRKQNLSALHAIIQIWMLTFGDIAALDTQFDETKIAMGEIRSLGDLAATDWSSYWGAVQEVSDRNGGTYRLPGRPWRFSQDELTPIGDPALRGEHNHDVCAELGFSGAEIETMVKLGALVAPSAATRWT